MSQARRKRRVITQIPRQMETMNGLIVPRLFSGLETSAPATLESSSFTLTHSEICNFAFHFFRKPQMDLPMKLAIFVFISRKRILSETTCENTTGG
jgi:hypothetical protein